MNWLKIPKKVYFKNGSMAVALKELSEVYGKQRAMVICDADSYKSGVITPVDQFIRNSGIRTAEIFAEPTVEAAAAGLPKMQEFQPDVIVAVGDGSVMSAAKALWLLYENPELDLNALGARFDSVSKDGPDFPKTGDKAMLVAIPTISGTGAEASPHVMLKAGGDKYLNIASYSLLPEICIIDPDFSMGRTPEMRRFQGVAGMTSAVRAFLSPDCSAYQAGFAKEAALNILEFLDDWIDKEDPNAGYKVANACVMAGMAYANAADRIDAAAGSYPNAAESDMKKIDSRTLERIREIASNAGIKGKTDDEIFKHWIKACENLSRM